jgi:hypothetical protein
MAHVIDILIIPTYDLTILAVMDNSTYDGAPPTVTLTIEVPGFDTAVGLPFTVNSLNIYDSVDLGISTAVENLPDGNYCISYMIDGETEASVTARIMREDALQQKFDEAFLKLDMTECDRAIKKQSKVNLMSIYFFMQAAMAASNNCAIVDATRLYTQADTMLNSFISENCGCSGNNYTITFS